MIRINRITDGLGNTSTVSYGYLTSPDVYSAEHHMASSMDVNTMTLALPVVKQLKLSNGICRANVIDYQYKDLYVHMTGAGVLGFGSAFNNFGLIDRIEDKESNGGMQFLYGPDMQRCMSTYHEDGVPTRQIVYANNMEIIQDKALSRIYYLDDNVILVTSQSGTRILTFFPFDKFRYREAIWRYRLNWQGAVASRNPWTGELTRISNGRWQFRQLCQRSDDRRVLPAGLSFILALSASSA